ncbi:phenylalanine--tRNA ligase subunit beta [Planctomycetota bacterium]
MKISLNWLNDYIDIGHDAEVIAETLSDAGFPCEGIDYLDGDTVIDMEVTSNRGDCLGHIGAARELSVASGKPLRLPEVQLDELDQETETQIRVSIDEPDLCDRYTGRFIEGVTVGPTPDWMRMRLEAVGLRSVSNVVDATNYALMETGQPPHAFDYDKIAEGQIVVRKARDGETLESIDGSQCKLTPEMLIIADAHKPVAIAGVMGGLESEVSDTTTRILLEDASFDPVTVRTASRYLSLPSDAAYRFERIVDIERIDWASQRTAQLIQQVAGGKVARGVVDAYPRPRQRLQVSLRLSRLQQVLGINVPSEDVKRILTALQCEPVLNGDTVTCTVPSWRSDIYREVDLIEEVARCYGYDKVPTRRRIEIDVCPVDARQNLLQTVGTQIQACGYYEAITVDFVDEAVAGLFTDIAEPSLAVHESSRKGANLLRQTLLGSLLTVLKTNVHAKTLPCRVFEIAHTFKPTSGKQLPEERTKLTCVADSNFRQLRSTIEATVGTLVKDATVDFIPVSLPWAEAGAHIVINGQKIGQAGVFSETVLQHLDIKNLSPVGAELDLDGLAEMSGKPVVIQPIPRFPAIERDLSIIVKESMRWADIVAAIKDVAPGVLEEIAFVEIYRGKGITQGCKSVTLSLRFRDAEGTLTHDSVDGYQADIVGALEKSLHAQLRTV